MVQSSTGDLYLLQMTVPSAGILQLLTPPTHAPSETASNSERIRTPSATLSTATKKDLGHRSNCNILLAVSKNNNTIAILPSDIGAMTRSTPSYTLAAARAVADPNPRDPGSGTHYIVDLALRRGPQPRDDGSNRQCSGRPPKKPQPRDPGTGGRGKRRERSIHPRDAGRSPFLIYRGALLPTSHTF